MASTSLAAYEALKAQLPSRRLEVLSVIESAAGGLALFQVAEILGRPMHTVSGRMTELAAASLIEATGSRIVNPESGKAALVWRVRRTAEPQLMLLPYPA